MEILQQIHANNVIFHVPYVLDQQTQNVQHVKQAIIIIL